MYRNILINNPARIYQKNHQLVVEVDGIHRFPIEDIATLVIDNQQTSITGYSAIGFSTYITDYGKAVSSDEDYVRK